MEPCPECGAPLEWANREVRTDEDEYEWLYQARCPECGWLSEELDEDEFESRA